MARIITLVCLAVLVVGCTHRYRIRHYSRDVALSVGQDVDLGGRRVRLVSISPGGLAVIELSGTAQKISAIPGDYFVSDVFGSEGLQLLSTSPEKKTITLRQRWADTR